jgi:hypothetical protein
MDRMERRANRRHHLIKQMLPGLSQHPVSFIVYDTDSGERLSLPLSGMVAEKYKALLDRAVVGSCLIKSNSWMALDPDAVRGLYDLLQPRMRRCDKMLDDGIDLRQVFDSAFGCTEGCSPKVLEGWDDPEENLKRLYVTAFKVGSAVVLRGLNAEDLNGQWGKVIRHQQPDRVAVCLEGTGREVAVKPCNLMRTEELTV